MVRCVIDIETYKRGEDGLLSPILDTTYFTIGGILEEGETEPRYFYTPEEMWDWIINKGEILKKQKKQLYIYGHNTSYDLAAFGRGHLHDQKTIKIYNQNPMFAIIGRCAHKDKNIYLLDTKSFYKGKLEDIGKDLGIPKLSMPKQIRRPDDLRIYLKRDLEITMKAINTIKESMEKLGMSCRKILTAGNLSITRFMSWCEKQRFNGKPYSHYLFIKGQIHRTADMDFIRKSLRGAYCQAFQKGTFENCTYIDKNKLYSWETTKMDFPDLLSEEIIEEPDEVETIDEILEHIGCSEATVNFPEQEMGYLPIRYKHMIYFPTQKMKVRAVWTNFELKRAKELGYDIERIHKTARYRKLPFNPLGEYIIKLNEQFKEYKAKGDKSTANTIKLLMNSVIMKFSQLSERKDRQSCLRKDVTKWEQEGYEIETTYEEYYIMVKKEKTEAPRYSQPIISAIITAMGRDEIYREIKKIPKEDRIYSDTDSIIFKGSHLNKFKISEEMGDFKIERKEAKVEVIKEKIYRIEWKEGEETKTENKFSGISNKNQITERQMEGKDEITTPTMYTINNALKTGEFDKVGTFYNKPMKIDTEHSKKDVIFPEYYYEERDNEGERITDEDLKKLEELKKIEIPENIIKIEDI